MKKEELIEQLRAKIIGKVVQSNETYVVYKITNVYLANDDIIFTYKPNNGILVIPEQDALLMIGVRSKYNKILPIKFSIIEMDIDADIFTLD